MKPYFIFPLFLQKLIWVPTRLTLILFGRVRINGLESLVNLSNPIIFACNHSSEIDPFMVPASLSFWSKFSPLFYITREKNFYNTNGWRKHLFGGLFINAWGGYSAQVGLNDYEKSLSDHIEIVHDGGSFCIFPEGGITKDGRLQKGKGGVAYLSEVGQVSIVPVAISGVYGMSMRDFFSRKRKITINFGRPITPSELSECSLKNTEDISIYRKESEYIMQKIQELKVD